MSPRTRLTRRRFLRQTAASAMAAVAVPYLVPGRAFGANAKVLTGHIGVGGQGRGNLGRFRNQAVAVCDVDKKHAAKAAELVTKSNGKCDVYADFRKLLMRKEIDAVVVSTPDHWHALPVVRACEAGKHVYCEKPLTLTIAEGRVMVRAARQNKCIVQTGSQQRSAGNFRTACELVRSGRIGKLQTVEVGIPGCNHPGKLGPDSDPPEWLDYDFWLGPASLRPYNEKRVHYNFRFWLDYSGGQMTNWGAHHIDIAQWGMGTDDTGPIATEGTATFDAEERFTVPASYDVTHTYANGVKVHVGQKHRMGTTFIGSEGKIYVNRGKLTGEPEDVLRRPAGADDVKLYVSGSHAGNWLDCIQSGKLPICDVEIGHRTATVCHLGNICAVLGRQRGGTVKIQWDPAKEQIVGDDEANAMLSRPYREPWKL
ncbi:MAG: Gfo/Idh/MocA family oxidoreductase [Pirellulales bacterium]|nr:Gfo/Idh/MocA family oxidoreductase [Pirellulales bacterium]